MQQDWNIFALKKYELPSWKLDILVQYMWIFESISLSYALVNINKCHTIYINRLLLKVEILKSME